MVAVPEWGGLPVMAAQAGGPPQRIHHITLHHQGETWRQGDDVAAYLRRLQTWSRSTRHWADIPYHYVIAPDGRIFEARPLAQPGDTNTEYDPEGHALVMLLGNFEEVEPTPEQLHATVALLAWLAKSQGLADQPMAQLIASHKDYSAQTVCPGRHLYRYLQDGWLPHAVALRLQGLPEPPLPASP